jgi:hypothetical protein
MQMREGPLGFPPRAVSVTDVRKLPDAMPAGRLVQIPARSLSEPQRLLRALGFAEPPCLPEARLLPEPQPLPQASFDGPCFSGPRREAGPEMQP